MSDIKTKIDKKLDEELIQIFVSDPGSPDGRVAKEILEYRKYKALKTQNTLMVIFTMMITAATVIQVLCECKHLLVVLGF